MYPFWESTRSAVWGMFGRMNVYLDVGRPADYAGALDAAAETADAWVTPDLVNDYQDGDLAYFPAEERDAVGRAVRQFQDRTSEVPSGVQPTPEQIERGYALIGQINHILTPHFGGNRTCDGSRKRPGLPPLAGHRTFCGKTCGSGTIRPVTRRFGFG